MVKQKLSDWQIADAARLDRLWKEKKPKDMSQAKFAAEYDMGTQSNVNLYLKGKAALNLKAVGQFAKVLKVRIDDISPTLADQVRELYEICDPARNYDYKDMLSPAQTKAFIQRTIQEEMERRQRAPARPMLDNGKSS